MFKMLSLSILLLVILSTSTTVMSEYLDGLHYNDSYIEANYDNHVCAVHLSAMVDKGTESSIVSIITWTKNGENVVLSKLEIPAIYMLERKVQGIEHLVEMAAIDLLIVTQEKGINLASLVDVYDEIIEQLFAHLSTKNFKLTQLHYSLMYHSSVGHSAVRLSDHGAAAFHDGKLCPPYEAYQHQGIFMCFQEYQEHVDSIGIVKQKRNADGSWTNMIITEEAGAISGMRSNLQELAEDLARLKACGSFSCKSAGCEDEKFDLGWYIRGYDWGCCGDYPECCDLAEDVCLIHDAICTCCNLYYFCGGPFCIPDPGC